MVKNGLKNVTLIWSLNPKSASCACWLKAGFKVKKIFFFSRFMVSMRLPETKMIYMI